MECRRISANTSLVGDVERGRDRVAVHDTGNWALQRYPGKYTAPYVAIRRSAHKTAVFVNQDDLETAVTDHAKRLEDACAGSDQVRFPGGHGMSESAHHDSGRAGLPTTVVPAGTSRVTTAPIPTTAPRPHDQWLARTPCLITAPVPR